jgi:hypothetical protein
MALPPYILRQCIPRFPPRSIVAAAKQTCVHYWRAVDLARRRAAPRIEFRQIDGRKRKRRRQNQRNPHHSDDSAEPEQQQVAEGGGRFADDSLRTRQDGYPDRITTGEKEYAS